MFPKEREELERENEKNFIEGYATPEGPFKYLNAEKSKLFHSFIRINLVNVIHTEIDKKMQDLEDSGLTREEVLYN
jgi:hypothetical protein